MERIIYTGAIADFYQASNFRLLLMERGYNFSNMRTAGLTPDCKRPVTFIHIRAKEVWIGYVSDNMNEYMGDSRYCITADVEEIRNILQERQ